MANAFAELPLALLTALAPAGACAFIGLFLASVLGGLEDKVAAKADKLSVVALVVALVGFIASFFHLANLGHAVNVAAGIGRAPLSNEVFTGGLFLLVAVIFWIIALTGKLKGAARKVCLAIVAIFALVFTVFCGLAYIVPTIPTWNNPWTVLGILGLGVFGGALLANFILALAGGLQPAKPAYKTASIVLAALFAIIALVGVLAGFASAAGFSNPLVAAGVRTGEALPCLVAGAILVLVAAIAAIIGLLKGREKLQAPAYTAVIAVIALVGIFCCRLVFYALQLGIALN
jgi:anaerobic dimethyl sulfoxide reductase subunit C (anchor subunit)/Tat-targeted selenate reductase subunit YnfH